MLARPLRSVLDVGCGEGPWQPVLADLRPRVAYVGVDPSAYAVERFGTRRNLRLGSFGHLDRAVPVEEGTFDLIVCVDVLGYVDDADVAPGLAALAARLGGLALVEVFTAEDQFEGDVEHYRRPAARRATSAGSPRPAWPGSGRTCSSGDALRPLLSTFEGPLGP